MIPNSDQMINMRLITELLLRNDKGATQFGEVE